MIQNTNCKAISFHTVSACEPRIWQQVQKKGSIQVLFRVCLKNLIHAMFCLCRFIFIWQARQKGSFIINWSFYAEIARRSVQAEKKTSFYNPKASHSWCLKHLFHFRKENLARGKQGRKQPILLCLRASQCAHHEVPMYVVAIVIKLWTSVCYFAFWNIFNLNQLCTYLHDLCEATVENCL